MVTIVDYSIRQSGEGKELVFLVVEGRPEFVRSITNNRVYMTKRKAFVLSTLDKKECKPLMGTKYPGSIKKVSCEEYDYTIPNSTEVIKLNFRYEYSDEPANIEEAVFETANEG